MILNRQKAQTVLETAILLLAIVIAFVAMQVYLRRSIAGRLKDNIDAVGQQYDPADTISDFSINHASNVTTTTKAGQEVFTNPTTGQLENRLMTTITTKTHYDNMERAGYEEVGGFIATAGEED